MPDARPHTNKTAPETFRLEFTRLRGGSYLLRASQVLPLPREQVFEFFKDPKNLFAITPAWLDFRMRDEGAAEVREGAEFDYTIRWLGARLGWRSRITGFRPPERFTDVQVVGPYARWSHLHTFSRVPGGTLMKDRVHYRLPLGLAGRLIHIWIINRQLEDIFTCRAVVIDRWARGKAAGQPFSSTSPSPLPLLS